MQRDYSGNTWNRKYALTALRICIIDYKKYKYTETCIKKLKQKGVTIIGVETKKNSIPFYKLKNFKEVAFVLGNEEFGLSYKILDLCDYFVHIPMQGFKNSLNVTSAASVILFHYTFKNTLNLRGCG